MATKCHLCLRNIKAKHRTGKVYIHHVMYTVHKSCLDHHNKINGLTPNLSLHLTAKQCGK